MPNWILTNYVFTGDTAELSQLHERLHELGDPLDEIALSDVIAHFGGDYAKIPCRGHIAEYFLCSKHFLEIKTLTAWQPMHEVWDFVKTKFPSLSYQYTGDYE